MPKEIQGHKDELGARATHLLRARKTIVYRVRSRGLFGCLAFICLMLAALAAFFILGLLTLTVALWIGCGLVLLTLITMVLSRIFGSGPKE